MSKTEQELFETAILQIFEQGGPAIKKGECMYRTPSGRACAVGASIEDEDVWHPLWEHGAIEDVAWYLDKCSEDFSEEFVDRHAWVVAHSAFLGSLEYLHDRLCHYDAAGEYVRSPLAEKLHTDSGVADEEYLDELLRMLPGFVETWAAFGVKLTIPEEVLK